ncbi:MAG: PIN domain-containing protein, partial [Candidatus Diapherotrites archaeon]|nr:PIN domain-containing protein [Candidatus Diapherotrites archaeon]
IVESGEELTTTPEIFSEFAFLLWRYGINDAEILGEYLRSPYFRLVYEPRARLAAIMTLKNEKISILRYNDTVLIHTARMIGAPIASFDKQLIHHAKRQGAPLYEHKI